VRLITGLCVSAVLVPVMTVRAEDFFFTPACGQNTGLFACCLLDPPDGVPCLFDQDGDPIGFLHTNNWGEIGACPACPSANQYPGPNDCIFLGNNIGTIAGGVPLVFDCVVANLEAGGGLNLTGVSVSTTNAFSASNLTLSVATVSSGGIFTVSNFNWLITGTSGLTAAEYCLGNALLSGGTQHTFNDGDIKNTGAVTWTNGQITLDGGDWTNFGTFAIQDDLPQTGRLFSGGAFNNQSTVFTTNTNPLAGQVTFDFSSNAPVFTTGTGTFVVGEGTRLRLLGAGAISPGPGAPASHVGTNGIFQLGGSLTSFILDHGTNILDDSPDGSGRVQFFNVEVPPSADVFVQSVTSSDNSLNILGQLVSDKFSMTGAAINGAGTGLLNVGNLLTSGFVAKDFNDIEAVITVNGTIGPGLELDNATLTVGDGTAPGATGLFTNPSSTFVTTFRVDLATDQSTLAVAPGSQANFDAPLSIQFNKLGTGSATVSVAGTLEASAPQTSSATGIVWVVGPDGVVRVVDMTTMTVSGPFNLDGGALQVDNTSTFNYTGPSFTATDGVLNVAGTFITHNNQNNPVSMVGGNLQIDPGGQVTLRNDTVGIAGTTAGNAGTLRLTNSTTIADFLGYLGEAGSDFLISGGSATLTGAYTLLTDSSLGADLGADVLIGGTDPELAELEALFDARITVKGGASVCVQPGAMITGSAQISVEGQSHFSAQGAQVQAESLEVGPGGTATQSGGTFDLSQLTINLGALVSVNGAATLSTLLAVAHGDLTVEDNSSFEVDVFLAALFGEVKVDPQNETPGSTVSVDKSISFETTTEANWSWGVNSALALTGGVGVPLGQWQDFVSVEIGGRDMGNVPAGFVNNFNLPNLVIGPSASAYLVDAINNGNRGPNGEPEAFYVGKLTFTDPAGVLNVNGLNLYVAQLIGDSSQVIDVPVVNTPGDVDGDGDVDLDDFRRLANCLGEAPEPGDECAAADIDGDGLVTLVDLRILTENLTGPQLPGACCLPDTTCLTQVQTQCEALGGTFQGAGVSCANVICPLPPQPCCLTEGPCTMLTPLLCIANGGTLLPAGTTCDETTCANAGPCCTPNGNCVVQSAADCAEDSGLFQGFGQSCAGAVCFMSKPCCLPDELPCVVTDVNLCLSVGGTVINGAASCEEVDCDTQACCLNGACQDLLASECTAAGGAPQGPGTSCSGGFGPTCPASGACDLPDGTCVQTTAEECSTQGGKFDGADTVCPPLGACCSPILFICSQKTEAACLSGDGTYLGDGIPCDDIQACVLPNGTCADLTLCVCLSLDGEPQGPGTMCATFGACCLNQLGGLCTLTAGNLPCMAMGGVFLGAGTTCVDPGCGSPPVGACCFEGDDCEVVSHDVCTFTGGLYLGDNVSCAGAPCGVGACCDPPSGLPCEEVVLTECGSLAEFKGAGTSCETVECGGGGGACCAANGGCTNVATPEQCAGFYLGDGTNCTTFPCGNGACCLVGGGCAQTTLVGCLFLGGTFQGAGSLCASVECPQPPEGACCFPDGDCLILDARNCTSNSGVYVGDGTTCEVAPCGAGACCHDDGLCTLEPHAACVNAGSTFHGAGTNCNQINCPPPFGACCFADGTCQMGPADQCGAGGVYQGNGTTCDPNPCGEGACCFADGSCTETTRVLCGQINGAFQGAGTTCLEADCPQPPTGACCLSNPSGPGCAQVDAELCALAGGQYLGDGVPCVPNPCQPGACCLPDGTCPLLRVHECLDAGGAPSGPGTSCDGDGFGPACPSSPGACCVALGQCSPVPDQDLVTDAEYCTLFLGGVYQGPGSTCTPNPCPQPP